MWAEQSDLRFALSSFLSSKRRRFEGLRAAAFLRASLRLVISDCGFHDSRSRGLFSKMALLKLPWARGSNSVAAPESLTRP